MEGTPLQPNRNLCVEERGRVRLTAAVAGGSRPAAAVRASRRERTAEGASRGRVALRPGADRWPSAPFFFFLKEATYCIVSNELNCLIKGKKKNELNLKISFFFIEQQGKSYSYFCINFQIRLCARESP